MKPIFKLIISIAIPLAIGGISGYFTSTNVQTWFTTIVKPSFNPPNWLFAPVWTALYIMMGIALFLVWNKKTTLSKNKAYWFWGIQMLLNFAWSMIFFYQHQIGLAMLDIALLWIMIILTIFAFAPFSKTASWLLVPYICWVSFASLLNFAIWQLNK